MKAIPFPLGALAFLVIALATPAFGGRMLDFASPPEIRTAAEPEATEGAVTEAADDEEESVSDAEMSPEPAENADGEIPVAAIPAAPPSRWKWITTLSLGVSADDNINLSSTHRVSDQIFTLGGNFQLLWGLKRDESFLMVDYAPSLLVYAGHSAPTAFEQKAALEGQWRLTKLTLGAELSAQTLTGGDVDVGDRANRTLWAIALHATYDYSTKTSFEVSLAPNASDYSHYLSSLEWINGNWIDYQLFPKTRVGAGVTLGYLKPEGGPAQTYQQALVRVSNPLSGKLSFRASGGVELRQLGGAGGTQTTPVFHVGVNYQPFADTEVSVEASRRIYSSASLADHDFTTTGATMSLRQRLLRRFLLTLASGFEDAQYRATNGAADDSRHDQYFFVRPSVAFAFTKWINLELYYQYRSNSSTALDSGFESNLAGAQATISF